MPIFLPLVQGGLRVVPAKNSFVAEVPTPTAESRQLARAAFITCFTTIFSHENFLTP
jgi:hypothetical protein